VGLFIYYYYYYYYYSFVTFFILARGRGCEFIFHFKIIILYICNNFFSTFLTF
jgi:hypothetical protein